MTLLTTMISLLIALFILTFASILLSSEAFDKNRKENYRKVFYTLIALVIAAFLTAVALVFKLTTLEEFQEIFQTVSNSL